MDQLAVNRVMKLEVFLRTKGESIIVTTSKVAIIDHAKANENSFPADCSVKAVEKQS